MDSWVKLYIGFLLCRFFLIKINQKYLIIIRNNLIQNGLCNGDDVSFKLEQKAQKVKPKGILTLGLK